MDRRPQAFTLHIQPDFPELVGCQLAPLARLVDLALECIKGDLANRRVEHVLDLLSDKRLALSGLGRLFEQRLESKHLAEYRCGFGEGQRGVGHQLALGSRQHLVHAVPQFVRQRHHIAQPPLVV